MAGLGPGRGRLGSLGHAFVDRTGDLAVVGTPFRVLGCRRSAATSDHGSRAQSPNLTRSSRPPGPGSVASLAAERVTTPESRSRRGCRLVGDSFRRWIWLAAPWALPEKSLQNHRSSRFCLLLESGPPGAVLANRSLCVPGAGAARRGSTAGMSHPAAILDVIWPGLRPVDVELQPTGEE